VVYALLLGRDVWLRGLKGPKGLWDKDWEALEGGLVACKAPRGTLGPTRGPLGRQGGPWASQGVSYAPKGL